MKLFDWCDWCKLWWQRAVKGQWNGPEQKLTADLATRCLTDLRGLAQPADACDGPLVKFGFKKSGTLPFDPGEEPLGVNFAYCMKHLRQMLDDQWRPFGDLRDAIFYPLPETRHLLDAEVAALFLRRMGDGA